MQNIKLRDLLRLSIFDLRSKAKALGVDTRLTRACMIETIMDLPYYRESVSETEREEIIRLLHSPNESDYIFYVGERNQ